MLLRRRVLLRREASISSCEVKCVVVVEAVEIEDETRPLESSYRYRHRTHSTIMSFYFKNLNHGQLSDLIRARTGMCMARALQIHHFKSVRASSKQSDGCLQRISDDREALAYCHS